MADLAKIKRNVAKMAAQNAPEADIDGYIASEGVTVDDVRNFKAQPESPQSPALKQGLSELSAISQDPLGNMARQEYNALPGWQKPIVAASDTVQLMANGATMGFGDKAVAAVRAPFTDKTYDQELAAQRGLTQAARNRAGSAGTGAEIAGSVGTALGAAGQGATLAGRFGTAAMTGAPGLLARTGLMAAEGAGYGALNAAGNDQNIGTGAAIGALGGAGGNLLGEGIAAGVGKVAGMFNAKVPQASVETLKAASKKAYKEAEDAGVMFNQEGVNRLRTNVIEDLTKRGFDPVNEPGIMPVIKRLEDMGGNVTFEGLDTLRKVAANGWRPGAKSNNDAITGVIARIDELVAAADPATVVMGSNPQAAADAVKKARQYWHAGSKLETVEKLVDRGTLNAGATGSGGNVENATRQQLKRILTNETVGRGFNEAEKAAARKAVLGTPTQNALRLAGKLSPQGNGLMMALGGGAAVASPHMAIPAMVAGYGAKKAAEYLSRKSVADLVRLISQGGDPASMKVVENAVQLLAKSKREALSRALMAVAVNRGNAWGNAPSQEQKK